MKSNRVLQTVRAEDSEYVALLESPLRQACRRPPHGTLELFIRKHAPGGPVDERRLVSGFSERAEDEVGERNFGDCDVRVWSAKDHALSVALRRSAMFIA